ncbi:MAG: hypothetical protein WBH56_14420 [Bacteroidota bacterium]
MLENDLRGFVAMIAAYSTYEYLIKRVLRDPLGRKYKSRRRHKAAAEGVVLLVTLLIGTIAFFDPVLIAVYVIVCITYSTMIVFEEHLNEKRRKRYSLEIFILRQIITVSQLYALWRIQLPIESWRVYAEIELWILGGTGPILTWLLGNSTKMLLIFIAYLFVIDGGTAIVKGILAKFPGLSDRALASLKEGEKKPVTGNKVKRNPEVSGAEGGENAGEWIGILERILALTFVLAGSYTAVAFAVTAKSIARFKELENKDFAEYYLLGTTGSLVVAILAGLLADKLSDLF